MYTHPVWVPLLLSSPPPGYSLRGTSTRGNALWVLQGNKATGCREEGRGWWRRGGGTYRRQPLRSEARLGSTTGLTSPRAIGPAAMTENRQPMHMESQLGSVTGPSGTQAAGPASLGNLRRSGPAERCLLGNVKQPEPPPLGHRSPLFRSVRDGQSHSGPHTTTRSLARDYLGVGVGVGLCDGHDESNPRPPPPPKCFG